jgi:DNA-binding NtrC family response regulator
MLLTERLFAIERVKSMETLRVRKSGVSAKTIQASSKVVLLAIQNDELLVGILANYLIASGYSVRQCRSIKSVLKRFQEAHGEVDLYIADLTEPVSKALEVGVRFWTLSSNLKVILLSDVGGWSVFNMALYSELPKPSVKIVRKPFSVLDLLLAVNELIGVPEQRPVPVLSGGR